MHLFFPSHSWFNHEETNVISNTMPNSIAMRSARNSSGGAATSLLRQHLAQPTPNDVVLFMLSIGTLLSLMAFSRLIAPIPDLVAGKNAVKDIRTEAYVCATEISQRGVHRSNWLLTGRKVVISILNLMSSTSIVTVRIASDSAPWTESQRSIVSENRLHMTATVIFVRVLENVLLFGVFPRTYFYCRATEHCSKELPLWAMAQILYPGGHHRPERMENRHMLYAMESDPISMVWSFFGVLLISVIVLSAQAVALNRSYLCIMSYLSSEWIIIDKQTSSSSIVSGSIIISETEPTTWDPRKKYKKGDRVYYPEVVSGSMYVATSDSPEGRPRDREFRGLNKCLQNELGHRSTSKFLYYAARIQFELVLMNMALWLILVILRCSTEGFFWSIMANTIATYGLLTFHRRSSTINELKQLNAEIISR